MKTVLTLAFAVAASALTAMPASANLQLAQKNNCTACHTVDRKLLGPAYHDVAKKYAGQADAKAKLMDSIRKGGSGKWGPVPMPAQPTLSEEDTKALAEWVLSGAK